MVIKKTGGQYITYLEGKDIIDPQAEIINKGLEQKLICWICGSPENLRKLEDGRFICERNHN